MHGDEEWTLSWTYYIWFILEITAKPFEVIFELIEGGVDVTLRIIRAAKSYVYDVVSILSCVPTP